MLPAFRRQVTSNCNPGAKLFETRAVLSCKQEVLSDLAKLAAKGDMGQISKVVGSQNERQLKQPEPTTFGLGDRVRKKSGAAWQGCVVGWYSTTLTPEGYAVESEAHPGSVQIYPVAALERVA
jgi:dihydrofolate reductase (trimethoprim resistance protein)